MRYNLAGAPVWSQTSGRVFQFCRTCRRLDKFRFWETSQSITGEVSVVVIIIAVFSAQAFKFTPPPLLPALSYFLLYISLLHDGRPPRPPLISSITGRSSLLAGLLLPLPSFSFTCPPPPPTTPPHTRTHTHQHTLVSTTSSSL